MTTLSFDHGLEPPGRGRGLRDLFHHRYLLRLLVDKEVQVRYRGSVLGLLWTYIKPAVQFLVFYIAMGMFLKLERGIENYAIYLFSGIVVINLFTESFGNAARSVVGNGGLIKKIYLPRELFPASSIWVAVVHFVPQLVVLLFACVISGWLPSIGQLVLAVVALAMIAAVALGLGLLFCSANVFFRDAENIVDLINIVAAWSAPVLYQWMMVRDAIGTGWFNVYMLNPLTVAVELFHYAFWLPSVTGPTTWSLPPNMLTVWLPLSLLVSFCFLFLGDLTFRRLEGRFAQEL